MDTIIYSNESIAAFLARVFLGLLFFFQGMDAVFNIKVRGVIETIEHPLSSKGIPKFIIAAGAYFTSYIELIGGFFLILGFMKYYVLCLLGLDILIAAIALGIMKPMWDLQFAFPRLVLILVLLLIPPAWDALSVDHAWSQMKSIIIKTEP